MTWDDLIGFLCNCDRDELWTVLIYTVLALKGDLQDEK